MNWVVHFAPPSPLFLFLTGLQWSETIWQNKLHVSVVKGLVAAVINKYVQKLCRVIFATAWASCCCGSFARRGKTFATRKNRRLRIIPFAAANQRLFLFFTWPMRHTRVCREASQGTSCSAIEITGQFELCSRFDGSVLHLKDFCAQKSQHQCTNHSKTFHMVWHLLERKTSFFPRCTKWINKNALVQVSFLTKLSTLALQSWMFQLPYISMQYFSFQYQSEMHITSDNARF